MKSVPLAFTACLFSLVLAEEELLVRLAKKGGDSNAPPPPGPRLPEENPPQTSILLPRITFSLEPLSTSSIPITETTTLSVIPTPPTISNSPEPTSSGSPDSTTTVVSTGLPPNPPFATSTPTHSNPMASGNPGPESNRDDGRRNLIIVLSAILGVLALIFLVVAICLVRRYQKGQRPFSHRGATPIDDEEIASWRAPSSEQKAPMLPELPELPAPVVDANTIGLSHFPGRMWNAQLPQTTPTHSRRPSAIIPESPSSMARSPNSRAGLTDQSIPGDEAYIPSIKRQSSRLTKAPPGHTRTKSRTSSVSNRSIWSYNGPRTPTTNDGKPKERLALTTTWYDPESDSIGREFREYAQSTSSPGTSTCDGFAAGGLSPRPSSRPRLWATNSTEKEIGRAIA
ncbi:hypothetical protein HYFRA_00002810 [Hymenoscyphus fraxineus]|uniref:Mid2 domain-containing protein n=1 Tax=Hymenoscyphus fraxineus TaxID=746836 RepID=A0A9N9PL19_9HELO|nr:hypothetical protein HYFRA_00002810 [Hymenoscyphus fraxineus]